MKFYVAGKWEDRFRCKELMIRLRKLGHEITKDWTVDEENAPGYPVINVVEDIRGVTQADFYVGIFIEHYSYKGALIEMGAALALRKPVFIVGAALDSCIFIAHPLVKKFSSIRNLLIHFVSEATHG